ncbi:MAG: endonuclease/exonuclease/phosphatase family protein [Muribaculaceae bacterium]|nr:endonuclease/exonuclease/phosphatase family protein [Muribaculaceae bacterium]
MPQSIFHKLGVYELMKILHELHKLGYQKLRWMSYMAPSGLSLRCHITTQDHICINREIVFGGDPNKIWCTSTGAMTTGEEIKPLVKTFMYENPRLIEIGKGNDPEYVEWFNILLSFAAEGQTPVFYGEYWSLPIGWIRVGQYTLPTPPTKMRLISWNIDGIKTHFEALKNLISEYSPEIICLQKVKDIKDSPEFEIDGYKRDCFSAPYAGIATYIKDCIPCSLSKPKNPELYGHLLKTEVIYPAFTLYNIYTPYSNPNIEGAIEHRRKFDKTLIELVGTTPDRQIICGDMNIVASDNDCWDGKFKRNQANFHDWERTNFNELLKTGHLIDTYRTLNPFSKEFSYFFRNDSVVRANNQGHRIDFFLASRSFEPQIVRAEIIKDCTISSNNPILLEIRY